MYSPPPSGQLADDGRNAFHASGVDGVHRPKMSVSLFLALLLPVSSNPKAFRLTARFAPVLSPRLPAAMFNGNPNGVFVFKPCQPDFKADFAASLAVAVSRSRTKPCPD